MTNHSKDASHPCQDTCAVSGRLDDLNSECFCVGIDLDVARDQLQGILEAQGQSADLLESHPHLFSSLPVFVSRQHIACIERVVMALEVAVQSAAYQAAVLEWAPDIARFDPGSPGGLLGLDFHLSADGPKVIEINTNPGGILLNALLGKAQTSCAPDRLIAPADPRQVEQHVLDVLRTEWRLQRGGAPLTTVAIVDETPRKQFLYPEFVLYRELFQRHGYLTEIHAPEEFSAAAGRLFVNQIPVDLIYNRLTDFPLRDVPNAALKEAYLAGQVVLTPHPRAHALYADKRNLSLLGSREFLQSLEIEQDAIDALTTSVPRTVLLTPANRDEMWAQRRNLFFKPAAGYGSKAAYRGDKLTHRVWEALREGCYVAQALVPPSERRVAAGSDALKVDIRCYAYRGQAVMFAARMYRGQTTNFRTQGGGFAPVLTTA